MHQSPDVTAKEIRLSICLPVYNFGDVLGETLDSILPQCPAGVEVIVLDGASTDRTEEVVASRRMNHPELRYVRLEKRGGIDCDLATSVELARGEYCWLFSGDDIMRDGALARVLDWIASGDDVYVCKHMNCDREMRSGYEHPVFRTDEVRRIDLGDALARMRYLEAAQTTEALFSFMSGLVVRREKWGSAKPLPEFDGSCWGHVARLLSLAEEGLKVCYTGEIWLDRRGDNDSFMDRGVVNRFKITIDGYQRLAERFFGANSMEAKEMRRLVRNEYKLPHFFFARLRAQETPARESRSELDRLFYSLYGGSDATVGALPRQIYRFVPLWLLRQIYRLPLLAIYRRWLQLLTSARAKTLPLASKSLSPSLAKSASGESQSAAMNSSVGSQM